MSHAWNTQLVLADGKNKGLHFPQNNEVGRKERNWWEDGGGSELKCRAPCYSTAYVSASPHAYSRGNGPALAESGERSFFKNKYNRVLVCLYTHMGNNKTVSTEEDL